MRVIKNIYLHLLCSLFLTLFVGLFSYFLTTVFSFMGYGVFLFVYILIGVGLFYFYRLTTIFYRGLTILSFFLNFVLWTIEQVITEDKFHNSVIYQDEEIGRIFILAYGALLLSVNKLILDEIFILFKAKIKDKMRLVTLLETLRMKLRKG